MIDGKIAKGFLGRFVSITTSNRWFYRGLVLDAGDYSLTLDDIKIGKTAIDYRDISVICEMRGDSNG